jgi:preprotein translocase subunit YajC
LKKEEIENMFQEGSWPILVIMGVFFILMIVMTIVPQRKQKKKMAEMLSSLAVGDKIMTIGGFVGTIDSIQADSDRFLINIGTQEEPVKVTVIKNAIRTKLDN